MSNDDLYRQNIGQTSGHSVRRSDEAEIFEDKKINLAVICGGESVEHEVSLWSAKNIVTAGQKAGFNVQIIYVSKDGSWQYSLDLTRLFVEIPSSELLKTILEISDAKSVSAVPGDGFWCDGEKLEIDVVFSIIHGTTGEDGKIQGLLEIVKIPYVGCGVLASAVGMDKAVAKALVETTGVQVAPYLVVVSPIEVSYDEVDQKFGTPFFVKPASLGSSVGVSKVRNADEFKRAMDLVFSVDEKALIEKMVVGREVECSLLTDKEDKISTVGEVSTSHDFYSYEAKYLDEQSVNIKVPADLPSDAVTQIKDCSIRIVKILGLKGMARMDFFYTENGEVIFNEVNTAPGFTALSMYPRLWKAEGYTDESLVSALVNQALR